MKLITTADGSHTLFVPEIDECYHSTHGAVQESAHIFIEAGLKQCVKNDICVLEIGFGTGLNAFLAAIEIMRSGKTVHYTALEKYPVDFETLRKLNYPAKVDVSHQGLFETLHKTPWGMETEVAEHFKLLKIQTDFVQYEFENCFDVVFFDAFSPEKQPEMWTQQQFEKIYKHCLPEAILTTYCAKGSVRRAMQAAGFSMERLPGPPGKREILRGKRI